ncbi:MAG: hypothetical protein RQ723_10835 [Desulfuromonadales bacterium]|nr:hypothetical protein [Desulfuromonadales bacterium]
MKTERILMLLVVALVIVLVSACTRRMAPFAPHRTQSEAHRTATTNQTCTDCHAIDQIGQRHRAGDDCLRCHRIVQGD